MNDEQIFKLIGIFLAIALPCLIIGIYSIVKAGLRHRERMMELTANSTAEKAAQYAAHSERLEQRVRVLERIVTEKGIVVSDEIEKLRDRPLN